MCYTDCPIRPSWKKLSKTRSESWRRHWQSLSHAQCCYVLTGTVIYSAAHQATRAVAQDREKVVGFGVTRCMQCGASIHNIFLFLQFCRSCSFALVWKRAIPSWLGSGETCDGPAGHCQRDYPRHRWKTEVLGIAWCLPLSWCSMHVCMSHRAGDFQDARGRPSECAGSTGQELCR